ncbi:uncharacterized protein [Amphiura filiformis]|uniref:uncharacterized protein isoform X2 n=1 Tax=Amphiura filiformis TaxID=82378 RepID=UPI003B20D695
MMGIYCLLQLIAIIASCSIVAAQDPTTRELTTSITECFHGPDIIRRSFSQISIGSSPVVIVLFENDVISCNGFLTTWKYFPSRAQPIKLLVLRPIGSKYKVVGVNDVPLGSVTLGVANEYDEPELSRIAVEAGDVLGLVNCNQPTSTCGHGIFYDTGGSRQSSYKPLRALTNATVDYTFVAMQHYTNWIFSVSAAVVSENVVATSPHLFTSTEGCPPIDRPQDGSVDPVKSVYAFGDVITVYCRQGFQLIGDETLFCSTTGSWLGQSPSCSTMSTEIPKGNSLTSIVVIAVGAGGGVMVTITIVAIAIYCKRKQIRKHKDPYYSSHIPSITRDPNGKSAELQHNNTTNAPNEIPLGTFDNEGYAITSGKDDSRNYQDYQGLYIEVT